MMLFSAKHTVFAVFAALLFLFSRWTLISISSKLKPVITVTDTLLHEAKVQFENGYLIHGSQLRELIVSMKKLPVQISVLTKTQFWEKDNPRIYNYNRESQEMKSTYELSLSSRDAAYVNPDALFMTYVKRNEMNEILELHYEQQ